VGYNSVADNTSLSSFV